VVGVARRPLDDGEFRAQMAAELQKYATSPVSAEVAAAFTARHHFVGGDLGDPKTYATLKARLEEIQKKGPRHGNVLLLHGHATERVRPHRPGPWPRWGWPASRTAGGG
jgi:glucose-6-phosphate 1-dehydrogenase